MKIKIAIALLAIICLASPGMAASSKVDAGIGDMLPKEKVAQQRKYSGNVKTKKFHNDWCEHYSCRDCTRFFKSKEAALNAGFNPCGKCKP